jgi:hypothetical protein
MFDLIDDLEIVVKPGLIMCFNFLDVIRLSIHA